MSYELISTVEVGAGGAASIEFTGIPDDGTDLLLLTNLRLSTGNSPFAYWRANSDSGSNYTHIRLAGDGSTASSASQSNIAQGWIGRVSGGSDTASTFGNTATYFSNYTSTTDKSVSSDAVSENNATYAEQYLIATKYTTSSAISSLSVLPASGTIAQYSTASLYKITAGDSGQLAQPKATGGTVGFAGGYWYHTFTSSGTFTPTEALTCDVLVVAGGGGGGHARYTSAGGGGAGGYQTLTAQALTAQGYTVTVGAGGSGGTSSGGTGSKGSNSSMLGTTSDGGGGGAGRKDDNNFTFSTAGGSGGGGTNFGSQIAGSGGVPGQGNDGGDGSDNGQSAGGGGGASAVGENGLGGGFLGNYDSGDGGAGTTWLNGNAYAGGGGGGKVRNTTFPGTAGVGGAGGGGNGGQDGQTGFAGTAGTGGGGGGAGGFSNFTNYTGGNGGSGVVIVRYAG